MAKTVGQIVAMLESRAPSSTAEGWDNVGLLVGDPSWKTSGSVITIDLTARALSEAKARGFGLIVTHHPCIFPRSHGLPRIVPDGKDGKSTLILEAIRNKIAIACCHTNFDQCALEVVEQVSKGLGVEPRGRLMDKTSGTLLKLVVFVPHSHVEVLRKALAEAGAGHIGNYDTCFFGTEGEGSFRGNENTDPFIGTPGELERTGEVRLETVIPRGLKGQVLTALFAAHPYEEVAYDLYPLEQGPISKGIVRGLGYGFWGEFPRVKSFSEVSRSVKSLFNVHGYWVTDPPPSGIRRIAFVAGKGASFVDASAVLKCDLFITGEAGYHTALDGARHGVAVMELGHRESERFFLSTMKGWLSGAGLRSVEVSLPTQKMCLGGKK